MRPTMISPVIGLSSRVVLYLLSALFYREPQEGGRASSLCTFVEMKPRSSASAKFLERFDEAAMSFPSLSTARQLGVI